MAIFMLSCKKDQVSLQNSTKDATAIQKQKGELGSTSQKTTNASLDSMAQAANLQKIDYIASSDSYLINSYDTGLQYQAKINQFVIDSLITFIIKQGSTTYNVTIDVKSEEIDVNGHSLSFDNYYDEDGITATSGTIKNMVAVFTVYYALFPNVTSTWADNGDDDVYHPATPRRFWGRSKQKSPCNELLHYYTEYSDYYICWIAVGSMHEESTHPC